MQVNDCNQKLMVMKRQLKAARTPAQQKAIKQRMLMLLQQRNNYQKHATQSMAMAGKFEGTAFAIETATMAVSQVQALKAGAEALKGATADLDIDALEDTQDDLEDLMDDVDEVHEAMTRGIGMDELDDMDLDAELAMLDDVDMDVDAAGIAAGPGGVSDPYAFPSIPAAAAPLPASAATSSAMPAVPASSAAADPYGGTV